MMQFERSKFREIPERLFHYTKPDAAWNIVTGGPAGQLCFLLKDAKSKNDAAELMLGVSLLEEVRSYLSNKGQSSILEQIQNLDKVYLNSFTETGEIGHMIETYGNVRLEFDFRHIPLEVELRECDYVKSPDVEELVKLYCKDLELTNEKRAEMRENRDCLFNYLLLQMGMIMSIPLLKDVEKWGEEREWRQVFHTQENDEFVSLSPGEPLRLKKLYPLQSLIGITIFADKQQKKSTLQYYYKFKSWLMRNGLQTQIRIKYQW
jgi:hypothetical protein